MTTAFTIVFATFAAGIGSVWLAAGLMRLGWGPQPRVRGLKEQHLLSLAAGALMATSFMHLLPEALESTVGPKPLFATLLVGLVFFFLLDKAELWHHGHEHHHDAEDGHHHDHHHHVPARGGGWAVLTGDSVHCFGDGILIASAFTANMRLGLVAALAVLRQSSRSRRAALVKVSLAGAVTPLGGLVGWWLVDRLVGYLPYFLVVASSSFIYVALADLIPQLQRRLGARETLAQVAWLFGGIALVTGVSTFAHLH